MRTLTRFIPAALVLAVLGYSQTGAEPYLGQKRPGRIPELFAPGLVSTPNGWEAAISFSPDGGTILFTRRADIKGTENRIMMMEQKDGQWTGPIRAPFAAEVMEYESFFSPDGSRVIFNSERPRPAGLSGQGEIWCVDRSDMGWGEPTYFPGPVNGGWSMSVTEDRDKTIYFTSMRNGKHGIYQSALKEGRYRDVEYLPAEINGFKGASHSFIAPDKSFILFDAQPEGMAKTDLYVSFLGKDGNWTRAVKFGKEINATKTEGIASVSPDGRYLFFHRQNDIYWVDSVVIGDMRGENR